MMNSILKIDGPAVGSVVVSSGSYRKNITIPNRT